MATNNLKAASGAQGDWKDQLSEIKENFAPPPPLSFQEWNAFKKLMKTSLEKAAFALDTSPEKLAQQLRAMGIIDKKGKKLSLQNYIPLIKKYKPDFYQQNTIHFIELRLQQNKGNTYGLSSNSKMVKRPTYQSKPIQQRIVPLAQTKWIEVIWKNVHFEDYAIVIQYGTDYSKPFPFSEARKSFKFLTKYILGLNRQPLKIQMTGNKIDKIENIEQLKDLVTILKVREEFIEQFHKGQSASIKSVLKTIERLSVPFLVEIAKAKVDDSSFIDYLSEMQAVGYKPVPVFEIIPIGQAIHSEDTFIFTVSHFNRLYLIWESTLPGRATYVFTTDAETYEEVIQYIYDYIASVQKAKRMKLRRKGEEVSELNCLTFITHSSFEHWKQKIERAMNIREI